jgi:hypothetical protein
MCTWIKVTIVQSGEVITFDQQAGEGRDEFIARATSWAGIPEGGEYYYFECTGYKFAGTVPEVHLGTLHVHHWYDPDERLPGLFLRSGDKVHNYKSS